jgi:hypothetical protein
MIVSRRQGGGNIAVPRGEVKIDGLGGGDGEVRKMLYNNDRDDNLR